MRKRRGRTSRVRRRRLCGGSESRGVNESYKPEFIELKKWLKDRKFEDTNLVPACFPDTGRGLRSRTSLQVAASPVSSAGSVHLLSRREACWGAVPLEALPADFTRSLHLPRVLGAGSGGSPSRAVGRGGQRAEDPRAGDVHVLQGPFLFPAASVF